MNRREFMKMSPAFPAAALTATLVVRKDGEEIGDFDVSILKVKAGDTVVLTAPGGISAETAECIKKHLNVTFPNQTFMVMGDGLRVDGVFRETK